VTAPAPVPAPVSVPPPVWVWGVPFAPLTLAQTVEAVEALIERGEPSYFITANLHYVMLTHRNADLAAINRGAAFILADGAPIVKAARGLPTPLPERVAGSDLIFVLCERAAREGRRIFLLGAPPGVAEEAAAALTARYPGLTIAGVACPPFRKLSDREHEALLAEIRAAKPDVLFVAFGQPKGERWIAENVARIGVPVAVQVGASLEFAAGRFARAPRWMQRSGVEWVFRMLQEPRRLVSRYAANAAFLGRLKLRRLVRGLDAAHAPSEASVEATGPPALRPAVFLDRDDTLIVDVPYLTDPAGIRLLDGAARALADLRRAGFALVLATNQSAIGRGLLTEDGLRAIHDELERRLAAEGAALDAIYHCPHAPRASGDAADEHPDRKPAPGMLLRAAKELGLDLSRSWMIGDRMSDVMAGLNAGCRSVLVGADATLDDSPATAVDGRTFAAADLAAAAALILADLETM
jgi:N-acetylglucosaminyldiphosphoundecaprenol N-acetyl-beta-D-mannosaminyltransferase